MPKHATVEQLREIVERIQADDPRGSEDLYAVLSRGMRYIIARQCRPEDIEDRLHSAYIEIVSGIKRGAVRDPDRLMGYARTVVQYSLYDYIRARVAERTKLTPLTDNVVAMPSRKTSAESDLIQSEKAKAVRECVSRMSPNSREVMTRHYLHEQRDPQIREEMGLNHSQLSNLKYQAKQKLKVALAKYNNRASLHKLAA